ncbi:hypothetical protein DFR49_0951 [Hephaestia caeni]|uniref:Uncharacterized protein n=1 Tax=Hephaestia caeni TaxID=645617 RepID=A0A397PA37_9SPHN|nr:hypothetical protein [Hephaestia caeni]RIA46410.1 hypothetical protein DFR49_0951 [Hephaestia caeni]
MSAKTVYERAPLGALIRYSNGEARPPERHNRKLRAWEHENGTGRLIKKTPAVQRPTYSLPAGFTLHEGNFGSEGVIVLVVNKSYSVDSRLHFEIVEEPQPGAVRVMTSFNGDDELQHLAPDMASAEAWLVEHRYPGARLEVVGEPVDIPLALGEAA